MKPLPKVIGLTGYAQVGKDSVAGILNNAYGYQRLAFADILREGLYRLNPLVETDDDEILRLDDLVDLVGWDTAKQNAEVRRLIQVYGTECGRDLIGEDVWVQAAAERIGDGLYVVSDVRFDNEAWFLRCKYMIPGSKIVRVLRPGKAAVNKHSSERGVEDRLVDFSLLNDKTLDELEYQVHKMITEWRS